MAKENSTVGRTLFYFWRANKKYKWYALGVMLLTPLVVFVRAVLSGVIFANIIEQVSLGLPLEELLAKVLPMVVGFLVVYVISKIALEELRLYWTWKMEVLTMYDLANQCFETISAQSMQFHSDRFSGSLVSQIGRAHV